MRRSFKYLLAFSLLIGGAACGDDDGDTESEESGTADTGNDNSDSDSTDNSNDNSDAGANNNNNDTGSATDPVTCAAAGDYNEVVTVGGLEQPFQVHIPDNLEDGAVVVIQLHGLGEDIEDIDAITELTVRADEEGFVVATPLGAAGPSGNAWNAGSCCDSTGADHVAALSAVIDATLELSVCGDEDSVFVAGQSNGAMMAQRMGCQTSAAVAGIISNAGFLADESGGSTLFECDDYQPTPILHVHGLQDGVIPFMGSDSPPIISPPIEDNMARWRTLNGCGEMPETDDTTTTAGVRRRYWNCDAESSVQFIVVDDHGHAWAGSPDETTTPAQGPFTEKLSTTDELWRFIQEQL